MKCIYDSIVGQREGPGALRRARNDHMVAMHKDMQGQRKEDGR
jgi:hypothetical protein